MKRLAAVLATALLLCPIASQARDHDRRGEAEHGRYDRDRDYDHDRRGRGPIDGRFDDRGFDGWAGGPPAFRGPRRLEGPPPLAYRLSRGRILPPAYRGYVMRDYQAYHLRRPPPGYGWYRSGDAFVLAAVGSGLIFEVISAEGY